VGETLKVLRVTAGGRRFALDAGLVRGVERPGRRVRLPGAPAYVRGVVEVQGSVVVVVDLARRLGLAPDDSADDVDDIERAVVVIDSSEPVGLAVDDPGDVIALDPSTLIELGPAGAAAGLRGLTPDGVVLLEVEPVVDGRALAPAGPVLDQLLAARP